MRRLVLYYWFKVLNLLKKQAELYRSLRNLDKCGDLEKKYREVNVKLYHARCELGPVGWIKVLDQFEKYPTTQSILAKGENE